MKESLVILVAGAFLLLSSCATNSDIDNLQSQIDGLKSGQIATITNQISSITGSITSLQEADREIKGYISVLQNTATELQKSINSAAGKIDDLEKAFALVNSAIENLQSKDSALERRIDDLKDYVDTQLRSAKDWVSATFATLEQYNGIVSEIGGLRGSISSINTAMEQMESRLNGKITLMKGEIEEAYTKAIGSLETTLKNWVNEQLEGYWTIAETEGKLDALRGSLEKEDESIREDIGKLRSSLDSAKTELTEGYKAAIKKAIDENNGILEGKIAEAVSGLNSRIDSEVSTINKRIGDLEERVSRLEKYLLSRIQSLSYIPRYDDDASTMWYRELSNGSVFASDTLDFRVSPADCADALLEVWESAVSAEAVSVNTRGLQQTIPLPVVSVTGGNGKISVVLDGSTLGEDFFSGKLKMKVVVIISDGNNELTSDYISMVASYRESPSYQMLAQWHFCVVEADDLGAHFAEAAKIDGAVNPASNAVGFGEDLYCAANESGNGKIMFYNATDKTDINPKGRCKRGITNSGEPCWYGTWIGDYIWMEATPDATLPAGTTLNIWLTLRPNTQNTLKYWLLEINDGGKWVPVGAVRKATVNGVDVKYNVELKFDPNGAGTIESPKKHNCEIDRNYTLTKSVDKVEYRIVCQSLMIADGTKVVTYIGETSANRDENPIVRFCGEDSLGTPTVTHHTWIAIVR